MCIKDAWPFSCFRSWQKASSPDFCSSLARSALFFSLHHSLFAVASSLISMSSLCHMGDTTEWWSLWRKEFPSRESGRSEGTPNLGTCRQRKFFLCARSLRLFSRGKYRVFVPIFVCPCHIIFLYFIFLLSFFRERPNSIVSTCLDTPFSSAHISLFLLLGEKAIAFHENLRSFFFRPP